jgi:sugar phosphate isomerase/epimerase
MSELWSNNCEISGFADEIDPDLAKQIEVLEKLGIRHVEMRGVNGKSLVDYPLDEVEKIKTQLDAHGIRLSSVGSPIGKIPITEDLEEHFRLFQHTVEIAHVMEVPYIRMFSFFIPEGQDAGEYRDEVFRRIGRMVDYAAAHEVVLLHENEKAIYGDVADRCLQLMEHFYGDHFKAVFDFANFVQCHQDTLKAYEMLKPYIAYIHVKDATWDNGQVVPAGHGDGNVRKILKDLLAGGYHGFLSLEPHLADFHGFASLEREDRSDMGKMSGEESFTLAYNSLKDILE